MAGRPKRVSDEEIIGVLEAIGDPYASTREISDELEISHNGTYRRLMEFEEEGIVESRKFGNTRAWKLKNGN